MSGLRRYNPLPPDHPLLGKPCAACEEDFQEGDVITLVPLGPGEDLEQRRKAREGRPHNAVTAPVHWACATGHA